MLTLWKYMYFYNENFQIYGKWKQSRYTIRAKCVSYIVYRATLGDGVVKIDSQFLAMDWRNNPKEEGSVTITTKPTLVWH